MFFLCLKYYASHERFLTAEQSVFLLLMDGSREDAIDKAEIWLGMIDSLVAISDTKAQVLIACSHADSLFSPNIINSIQRLIAPQVNTYIF